MEEVRGWAGSCLLLGCEARERGEAAKSHCGEQYKRGLCKKDMLVGVGLELSWRAEGLRAGGR